MKADEQLILLDLGDDLTGSAYCTNVEGTYDGCHVCTVKLLEEMCERVCLLRKCGHVTNQAVFVLSPKKPEYSGTCEIWLGTNQKCPGYQGVLIFQVSLCTKGLLWGLN